MELQLSVLLWVLQFRFHFGCDVVKPFQNKRLLATTTTVLNTTTMTSDEQCVMTCYYDKPSCLAVNVITIGDVISCELTTGLSSETDMVDDSTCVLYVTDYNKCAEDPGFCQNSGTCQPTWTSARCHCTDLFGGDRCELCAGKRFTRDECDTCACGYYGDKCHYSFNRHDDTECLRHQNLHSMASDSNSDDEDCKQWCADHPDCGGFVPWAGTCFLRD